MASLSHPTKKRRKKKRKMSQWWSEISLLFSAVPSSSFSSPIFSSINGQLRVGARGRVLLARWNARLSSNNKVFPGAAVAEFCATVSPNFERKMLCLFYFFLFQKKNLLLRNACTLFLQDCIIRWSGTIYYLLMQQECSTTDNNNMQRWQ